MSEKIRQPSISRIFFDELVTITLEGRETPIQGRALNISSGGIYICAPELLPESKIVHLHFCLPDGEPVTVDATVVRSVNPQNSLEPTGMAMRFESIEPDFAERIHRFIESRLQPATGNIVRMVLGELGVPIAVKTQSYWDNFLSVDAELPFLRLGTNVTLQLPEDESAMTSGFIRWVSVHVSPPTGVPRLNIGIELTKPPEVLEFEEEQDPVCNIDFAEHSAKMDRQVRAEMKAAACAAAH